MNTTLLYALGVGSFVLAILISIGLHELGHMVPAKKFGAKVTQYFIGFGPTVWSRKRGETEYGIKAIPLGGYVRIIGMMPPVKGHFEALRRRETESTDEKTPVVVRSSNTGLFTGLVSSAKKTEYEQIDPADEDRLFYRLPWWKKFIVMAAGPSVNIVLAFLCFLGVFALYGQRSVEVVPGPPVLAHVAKCSIGEYGTEAPTCAVADQSPAWRAGLLPGDKVLAFNGNELTSWEELTVLVADNGEAPFTLTVARADEELALTVRPKTFLRPSDSNPDETVARPYMGVAPAGQTVREKKGVGHTLVYMKDSTVETFRSFAAIPEKVKNVALAIVGVEERDPNGPVSIVGGARFSGEVAAYEPEDPANRLSWADKIAGFFMLVGTFNLFIGIFNFLPILPLDGGHMAGTLWEATKNAFARLFRRPKPAPVDIAKMLPVAYGFGIALFLLGMLLIVGDILVPIKLMG